MNISIPGSDTFTLSGQTIDKLIRAGDGDAALMYLYMLKTHGKSTDKQAAEALGKGIGWVNTATALLSRVGLIEVDTGSGAGAGVEVGRGVNSGAGTPPGPREYTQDEVVAEIASGSDFAIVVDETARRLAKPLSPDDMMRLYGIYENLRLPPEVILQLITHCINECRTSGDGRSPSVKYIEKAAYTWEREGIFTIEKAEEYLKALEARKSIRGRMKQALQITGREFSATEKRYVDSWIDMGFEPEVVALAYDKTVVNTGGMAWPYIDTILGKWNSKGLHTLQQVREKEGSGSGSGGGYSARTGRGRGGQGGQKHGEPSREEMERMKRLLEKIEEE